MLGQGGTCKIQQRHKWKLSWVENRATGEPCCTDDRGNTYGTTSMNLITQSGVPPATPPPLPVWQAQSSAEVRSSKRKQDLIIIIRQLHMSPGYVTSGGRWDWKGCWNRNDRASPWAYYNQLILKYRSPPLIQFPLAWFLMQFCITFCLL